MIEIALLISLFMLKHFVADVLLQSNYMGIGKGMEEGWVAPLSQHAFVHSIGTFLVCFVFLITGLSFWMATVLGGIWAIFDFICHFMIDRTKSNPFGLGRHKDNKPKWIILSIVDQLFHFACYGFIIWRLHDKIPN